MEVFVMASLTIITTIINITILILCLPRKKSLSFTIAAFTLLAAAIFAFEWLTGMPKELQFLRAFVYLPPIILLFEGLFFQKLFIFFLPIQLTIIQNLAAEKAARLLAPYGSEQYYILFLTFNLAMYAVYLSLVFRFGRRLLEKLFAQGNSREWALYTLGVILSFTVSLTFKDISTPNAWSYFLALFFILWSFGVLCFAIINAHAKSRQRYEAEFARSIVSTGREHYQKINELFDTLRILRHDYKYHLDVILELLHRGDTSKVDEYLTGLKTQLLEQEPPIFCNNSVINALLASYAQRCQKSDIAYTFKVALPYVSPVSDYDMCIVLGNLLENAVEACQKITQTREIKLVIKPQGEQFAIMVRNSFDGELMLDGEQPISMKKDGGLGLRSVQAVASRHGGETLNEWDNNTFTAYVLMDLRGIT